MKNGSKTLRVIGTYGPAFVLLVALLILWQLYVQLSQISNQVLPAPLAILQALGSNWDVIEGHTLQTLLETVLGMASATLLGLLLAIVLNLSSRVRKSIYPLLIISQTIPIIALAPLLLIWFGYDLGPKVLLITIYCFFPISVAVADGLASAEPELINLLKSMRASRWQTLWLVQLPGAMPAFFSGLRIAVTYSVTGAIFSEYIGGASGLGIYMQTSAHSRAIVLVFASILVVTILSLLLFGLVTLIERIALPWYHVSARRL